MISTQSAMMYCHEINSLGIPILSFATGIVLFIIVLHFSAPISGQTQPFYMSSVVMSREQNDSITLKINAFSGKLQEQK
jgi:hypothetical protein